MKSRHFIWPSVAVALFLQVPSAFADYTSLNWTPLSSWTWSASSTSAGAFPIAGNAAFSAAADGSFFDLKIVLTDTASAAITDPSQVLLGLAYDVKAGGISIGALTMLAAYATGGTVSSSGQTTPDSNTKFGTSNGTTNTGLGLNICAPASAGTAPSTLCSSTVVGGWDAGYTSGGISNSWAKGASFAIGSAGWTYFNGGNVGQGEYGLVPSSGYISGSHGNLQNNSPYVFHQATFILRGLPSLAVTISNVSGLYGTAPDASSGATQDVTTPEPSTLSAMAGGAFLLALAGYRKRTQVR